MIVELINKKRVKKYLVIILTLGIMTILSGCSFARMSEAVKVQVEKASWSDDMVIEISDPLLLEEIQNEANKESKVRYEDVKEITSFSNYKWNMDSIHSIKYFTSLEEVSISLDGNMSLENLKYCRKLETVGIYGDFNVDLSPL